MKIITVSREFGAGGGEVGRRLAEALGWKLLDRELLHQAAAIEHVPDADLERFDEKALSTTDRFRLHPLHEHYIEALGQVVSQAAAGGNVILVGRGARQLLGNRPDTFHLRLVAPLEWRVRRMAEQEGWSPDQSMAHCLEVDRTREKFNRYFFGANWLQPAEYDLVANSAWMAMEDVASTVVAMVRETPLSVSAESGSHARVLTLARELGAAEAGFAQALADHLELRVCDRELFEKEATRLHVTEAELETIDEHPSGIFHRFHTGGLYQRYLKSLRELMNELAAQGNVLLVGRGGSRILRNHSTAFHVRLVASMEFRIRRVMDHRWVREDVARTLIDQSDWQRYGFYDGYFSADWASPLEYHMTVNSGWLGPAAVDLIADAASRHWARTRVE